MTAGGLIVTDHVVALLTAATWFGAGAAAALHRARLALVLLAAALAVTVARVATAAILAGQGWWFVQEKVLLGLPMSAVAGGAAVLIAGPQLGAARRKPSAPGEGRVVVSLLTAGYSAVASLGVTLLTGYPLTWGTALIATSLVCAAALLTAWVVTPPPARAREEGAGLSRRRFLTVATGVVAASTGALGVGVLFKPVRSVVTGGGPGRTSAPESFVSVSDLRGANAPAAGGARREYVLTARQASVRLRSGREIPAWTYNGELPGPAITATEGDLIEVILRNTDIDDGVTVHWHGYDVACGEDGAPGVTQNAVAPGEEFVYRFRADQVGTYWYHTHQASHRGVRRGLYGTLVVTPRGRVEVAEPGAKQLDLTLPVHTFDGTVVIADQDGRIEHAVSPGVAVRLRLINTDSDPHRFTLAGTPFRVAAVDGRDLHRPAEVSHVALRLPAGGRYDLAFAMPDAPVALTVDNDADGGLRLGPENATGRNDTAADLSSWPELDLLRYGTPAAVPFDVDDADRRYTLVLDRGVAMVDGAPAYAHTVNGRGHPSIPDQLVATGDLVRFTVVNRSLETHPWHLHGHPVLILSRDGTPSSGSPLWVDTFDVRPGQVWEVAFEATNPGIWMNHCHNLPHAHQGMMLRLAYGGVTGIKNPSPLTRRNRCPRGDLNPHPLYGD